MTTITKATARPKTSTTQKTPVAAKDAIALLRADLVELGAQMAARKIDLLAAHG